MNDRIDDTPIEEALAVIPGVPTTLIWRVMRLQGLLAKAEARVAELEAWFPRTKGGALILPERWVVREGFDNEPTPYVADWVYAVSPLSAHLADGGGIDSKLIVAVFDDFDFIAEKQAKAEAARLNAAREAEELNHG